MTVLEAAQKVLLEKGHPLPVKELTSLMLSTGYWKTNGLTPEATVQALISVDIKNQQKDSCFFRSSPGCFGLKGQAVPQPLKTLGEPQLLFEDEGPELPENEETLTFTDAAEQVLQKKGEPMHYRDITTTALKNGWLSTKGKTPEATMYAQILTEITRYEKRKVTPRFKKLGHGKVALSLWDSDDKAPIKPIWSKEDQALLDKIKSIKPEQFEKLVALFLSQVFSANITETPRSNDGGIDARGKFPLNGLMDVEIAAQAKRYKDGNIRRPEIQKLRGSMGPQSIGFLITTTDFSQGAKAEAKRPTALQPIGLINGVELVGLLKSTTIIINENGDPLLLDDGENVLSTGDEVSQETLACEMAAVEAES